MWADDYIESLTLLPGTLAELGATGGRGGVSLVEEGSHTWDVDCAMSLASSTCSILGSLEEDFFYFLDRMVAIAAELKSVLARYHQRPDTEIADQVERALAPIHGVLFCLAPGKAYSILLPMKNFLESAQVDNWGRRHCAELLNAAHEKLTELRPRCRLKRLKHLRRLLGDHRQRLGWLASHPAIEEELGRPNLFDRLIASEAELKDALRDGVLLAWLEEMLEELNLLRAIDFQE